MKKSVLYKIIFGAIFLALVSCSQEEYERSSLSMGTTLNIKTLGEDQALADSAINAAFMEAERINRKFSTYIKNNLIWNFNRDSGEIHVEDEFYRVMESSDKAYRLTNGAFDPAVGNLVDLLGFENGHPNLPPKDKTDSVLATVGWKHIKLLGNNKISKDAGISVNFGGIAKGYAVDRIYEVLKSYGLKRFIINFGGEVKGSGQDWTIGIAHPRKKGELLGRLVLEDVGVATSGDYEQFFEQDGIRVNHIINPATGESAGGVQAVSVIAESVTDADALATGVFVLGPEKGLKLINSLDGIECLIVDMEGKLHESENFNKFFRR